MYYLCSEYKGTDQLCSYCTADLRLCFGIGKNTVFLRKNVLLMHIILACDAHPCNYMYAVKTTQSSTVIMLLLSLFIY